MFFCKCVSVSGVIHNVLLISAAVYLCKRTMQNKARLELADYEAVSNLLFSSRSLSLPVFLNCNTADLRLCTSEVMTMFLKESRSDPSLTLNVGLCLHNPGKFSSRPAEVNLMD